MSTGILLEVDTKQLDISFFHGLGDISNFARLIPIYKKYGIDIGVKVTEDKRIIVEAAGGRVLEDNAKVNDHHKWSVQNGKMDVTPGNSHGYLCNKIGCNSGLYGLEEKATKEKIWKDLKEVDIQIKHLVEKEIFDKIALHIKNWLRPIVLWHSIGNTNRMQKSFNEKQQQSFTYEMLNRFNGTLLILDWDCRAIWTQHHRLKHSYVEFKKLGLKELAALMYLSDLMIGVDSGPYYYSALTDIPSVGIYFNELHPAEYMIPCKRSLALSMGSRANMIDRGKRFEFQILTTDGSISDCAEWCSRMLKERRYLPEHCDIAADVQLQEIVERKCKGVGVGKSSLSSIYDRNRSFDILLQECKKRFPFKPRFVETGCIRADEDWGGAGFSTALFGRYCYLTEGHLTSIDLDPKNCKYASNWCKQFYNSVEVICARGEDGIREYKDQIDVLYLDSLDSEQPNHQEENLKEFKAAESKLHKDSVVIIDDTPSPGQGKGGLTLQYMLERGWKLLYGGYQVVLVRNI